MPVCYRCKRRRVASECKYGPSPIKVSTKGSTASGVPSSTDVVPRSDAAVDLRQSDGYEIFAAGFNYVQKCPNGYLGPTAYSAIFLEHQGKLDMGLLDPCKGYYKYTDDARICEHSHNLSVSHKLGCHTPAAAAIRLGADILKAMPSQEKCTRLVERYGVFEDIVSHKPSIKIVHQSWWDTYGSCLKEPRDAAHLFAVSEELCRNAWSFLGTELPRNHNEWVASCQGHNFRWELLGILLSMFGLAAGSLPEWDSLSATQEGHPSDRRKFACSMRDLVEGCLLLCDHADNVSSLGVWLQYCSNALQRSCETGKTSEVPTSFPEESSLQTCLGYLLWKRHGSLVSSVTALGLHREPKEDYPENFMASELRKRQFIGVFVTDKTMAAMSGRPPLLSRRYSTCQLPLDISEDELIAEEPRLSEIKSKLDSHGWNTSGEVYPSTWARGLLLMNIIREEVLEITLDASNERSELMLEYIDSEQGSVNTKLRCSDLSKRCDDFYARLPQKIRYNPKQPIITTAHIFPRQVGLHLLYLHCHFLLERLSVSRTSSSRQRLVDLAIEMLNDILTLWAKRDWLLDFQWRFTLLVSNRYDLVHHY